MATIRSRIVTAFGRGLTRLRGGELTRGRLALALGLGVFIGTLPLYGLHLPLCVAASLAFRLDALLVYLGANISIPPVAPFLLFGSYQVGAWVLGQEALFKPAPLESARDLWILGSERLLILGTGSLLFGAALGLFVGLIAYWVSARLESRHPELRKAVARVVERYRAERPATYFYVWAKLTWDPLAPSLFQIAQTNPRFGRVLDLGAGRGQFALLLMELGEVNQVGASDHDKEKVQILERVSREDCNLPFHVEVADLAQSVWTEASADTVLLLDVLHYLPPGDQDVVLERACRALAPGGRLLLREANEDKSGGARAAKWFESLGRRIGMNRGRVLAFTPPRHFMERTTAFGLTLESMRGAGPLDNVLIVARRPADTNS